jgi:hypothetical protein
MGKMRNAYNILVAKPEGKIALERPRRRWEDNIRMGMCRLDSSASGQWPVAGSCEDDNEPPASIKGGEFVN